MWMSYQHFTTVLMSVCAEYVTDMRRIHITGEGLFLSCALSFCLTLPLFPLLLSLQWVKENHMVIVMIINKVNQTACKQTLALQQQCSCYAAYVITNTRGSSSSSATGCLCAVLRLRCYGCAACYRPESNPHRFGTTAVMAGQTNWQACSLLSLLKYLCLWSNIRQFVSCNLSWINRYTKVCVCVSMWVRV